MVNNLISRTAAVDAICAEFEYVYCYNCNHEGDEEWCEDCHRKYMKWSVSRDTVERVLNKLPTARIGLKFEEWKDNPNYNNYLFKSPASVQSERTPCSDCQEFDCYGCQFKSKNQGDTVYDY